VRITAPVRCDGFLILHSFYFYRSRFYLKGHSWLLLWLAHETMPNMVVEVPMPPRMTHNEEGIKEVNFFWG